MHCPFCKYPDSRVIDSRASDDGFVIRRRRECQECKRRFSTTETSALLVVKRNGSVQPFNRAKVSAGVEKACHGRPVTEDDLALLAQKVEDDIRATGVSQIEAGEIGKSVLPHLRALDQVAYLRFASVYQGFDSLDDFAEVIEQLREEQKNNPKTGGILSIKNTETDGA